LASVQDREELLDAADWILRQWPTRFLQVASKCGLTLRNFNGTLHLAPAWMLQVIVENLAVRIRTTSPWRKRPSR
jgi:hypothetical protein